MRPSESTQMYIPPSIGQQFICQSAPDIRCKLQNLQMRPQTNQNVLLDIVFMVYNNWDLKEGKWEQNKKKITSQSQLEKPLSPKGCLKAHLRGLKERVPALSVRNLDTGQRNTLSFDYAKTQVLPPDTQMSGWPAKII